jgi:hypothetical protein
LPKPISKKQRFFPTFPYFNNSWNGKVKQRKENNLFFMGFSLLVSWDRPKVIALSFGYLAGKKKGKNP